MKLIRTLLDRLSDGLFVSVPEKLGLAASLSHVPPLRLVSDKAVLSAPADASTRRSTSHSISQVDALDDAPGLYSARYSPKLNASDRDRRIYLLQNLQDKPRPWTARFHATIAIAIPKGETYLAEGICEGEIIPEERGTSGFGYDPIFLLPELGKTMAELSMDEKNRLSHRARAVINAKPILDEVFKSH